FEKSEPTALVVGNGYKFKSAMAFWSRRLAGRMFRPGQAVSEMVVKLGAHPNGSRAYPTTVPVVWPVRHAGSGRPLIGSTSPQRSGRVVAGSKMVPWGIVRPKASVTVPDCARMRSWKLV